MSLFAGVTGVKPVSAQMSPRVPRRVCDLTGFVGGIRNKEKQEIDFLIVRGGAPWLPVEANLLETEPSPNWRKFAGLLPCRRSVQIVRQRAWKVHDFGDGSVLVAGVAEALSYFA